jgi:hypothetical protein
MTKICCGTLLILILGVLLGSGRWRGGITDEKASFHVQAGQSDDQITFHNILGALAEEDGVLVSISDFESSDGVRLSLQTKTYKSRKASAVALGRLKRKAVRVIEDGPKADKQGRTVGERALLETKSEDQKVTGAELAWSDGPTLRILYSPSLRHVLLFERQRLRQ